MTDTASTPATPTTSTTATEAPSAVTTATTVKPGWKTSEFYLALAAKILSGLFAFGLVGDGSTLSRLAGVAGFVLTQLGYTVSRTMIKTAAPMLLLCFGLAATQPSCAWFTSEKNAVVSDVIDCTKGAAPDAIKEFGPLADALLVYATGGNGTVNADAIKDAAKGFGKKIGGCVLADAVARAIKPAPVGSDAPKSSPLESDPASLRRALAAVHPGVHFHTANGDL